MWKRTTQAIRYRVTATLWRLQKSNILPKIIRGYITKWTLYNFDKWWSDTPDRRFAKVFLIRDTNNFDNSPNSIWCSRWFCTPSPILRLCIAFCGHRRVAVARYRMIRFLFLLYIMLIFLLRNSHMLYTKQQKKKRNDSWYLIVIAYGK